MRVGVCRTWVCVWFIVEYPRSRENGLFFFLCTPLAGNVPRVDGSVFDVL